MSLGSSLRVHFLVQGPVDSRYYHETDKRNTGFKFLNMLLLYSSYVYLHCSLLCMKKHMRMHCRQLCVFEQEHKLCITGT